VESPGTYDFTEREVNRYGYDLMRDGKLEDALQVFELNTKLFPDAWNTYDSYGECLLEAGDTIKGIKAYEKSLELNPESNFAIEVIREFRKQ
jgi:tetratricopeptide (TPR) repeat protein